MKQPVLRDKHFYILLALFVACTVFYYFGELVIRFGWEALRWDIFYTVHDLQRMLFLVPVLYSSYYYRLRGAILANIISLLIFLPRAILISPYLESTLRTAFFVIMAAVFSILTVLIFNQRHNQNKLMQALKQSEEKNRVVLEQMYDSYYEVDLAGNFTFVNDSVCRNLGYSPEELIGNNYRITVPVDDIKPVLLAFNEVYRTGAPNTGFAHGILCKDGHVISIESSISLRKNQQGEIIGFRSVSRDVTERKHAEASLRESEELYRSLFENMLNGFAYCRMLSEQNQPRDFIYISVNSTFEKQTGLKNVTGKKVSDVIPGIQESDPQLLETYGRVALTGIPETLETYVAALDMWLSISIYSSQKQYFVAIFDNITERKQAEEALFSAEAKYRSLVENINDVFYTLDNLGNITYISPVVERVTLYKVNDLIGKPFIPLIYPDDLPALLDSFNRLVSGQLEPWEFRILDKDGRIIFVRTSSRPIYEGGQVVGITALMTDITGRKQMEQRLEEIATHDFLTGLPNRVLLVDRFNVLAALANRNKARLAVMSLDLDKFKLINDVYGHGAGDQVLKVISTRLTGITRASDTLARIGGDEFILVMMETGHMEDATVMAQKILGSFKEPLLIDGNHLHVSTSIGIAIYPGDGQDLDTLTKKSDAAMYYSKGHGRDQFKFFSDGDVQVS